jgi:aspartate aminotransferase/aminotransferase
MEKYISDRVKAIDASGIRKVFALAADLKDPINLSIGQPDFDVPDEIKDEAIRAIKDGFNKYSQTAGDAELLAKIKKVVEKQTGWKNSQTLVASGVSGGLLLTFMAMINPGDEVIIPDPYFVIYKHIIKILGGKCVFVDSYPDFRLPVGKIKKAITDRTKLIIVNSPTNPTGAVYTEDELKELAEAAGKREIPVLSDEIYDKFCYDGDCPSITKFYRDTILLKGFSKSYGMPGWRLAYVAVPEHFKEILEQMLKIQQYTFVCAPTPFQRAAIKALDVDVSKYVAEYKIKRDIIYQGLSQKFEVVKPAGAFYAFIKAPKGKATEFVEKAIKNNVLIIPGNVFSEKDTHFRISFATSNEKLKKGVEILCSIA